jgi:hypothetical protein
MFICLAYTARILPCNHVISCLSAIVFSGLLYSSKIELTITRVMAPFELH